MNNLLRQLSVLILLFVFSSCNKSGSSNSSDKIRPDQKPQVIDVLKGKSKSQVLDIKYKELKAVCSLKSEKAVRGEAVFFHENNIELMAPPADPVNPISNPTASSVIYDLKLQQVADSQLSNEVKAKLSTSIEDKTLKLGMTFKPVQFLESVDLSINQRRYIMKHSPSMSYAVTYELDNEGSLIQGNTEATIYEKIEGQKNTFLKMKIGINIYYFSLECNLERAINNSDPDLAAEFESQWTAIGK